MTGARRQQRAPAVPRGGASARTPYPAFDVTAPDKLALDWDDKTARVVEKRLHEVPAFAFFTPDEAVLLSAVCERLLPQDDRPPDERVPIAPWIDDRLARGEGEGSRYEGMPADGDAYRAGLDGIDETARLLHGRRFAELAVDDRDSVLGAVADGSPPGAAWRSLPARRFFAVLLNDVIAFYYAHPAAWAEIGFSGPSSPRGHLRLDLGRRDPWEAEERVSRSSVEIVRRAPGPRHASGEPSH